MSKQLDITLTSVILFAVCCVGIVYAIKNIHSAIRFGKIDFTPIDSGNVSKSRTNFILSFIGVIISFIAFILYILYFVGNFIEFYVFKIF